MTFEDTPLEYVNKIMTGMKKMIISAFIFANKLILEPKIFLNMFMPLPDFNGHPPDKYITKHYQS